MIGAALEAEDDLRVHQVAVLAEVAADIMRVLRERSLSALLRKPPKLALDLAHEIVVLDVAGRDHDHALGAVLALDEGVASAATVKDFTVSGVPRMERPIVWWRKAVSVKRSKTMSSGVSCAAPISCRMTCCSRSSSSGSNFESCQDVGQDVDRQRHVVAEHAGVEGGGLDAGRGVDFAADILDLGGDLEGAPRGRSLERHVLEQMRHAVLVVALVAGAGLDPDAQERRIRRLEGFRWRLSGRSTDGLPQHPYSLDSLAHRPRVTADIIFHHFQRRMEVLSNFSVRLHQSRRARLAAAAAPRQRAPPQREISPDAPWRAPPSARRSQPSHRRHATAVAVCGSSR